MAGVSDPVSQYKAEFDRYERFAKKVEEIMGFALETDGIKVAALTSRAKDPSSFKSKIEAAGGRYTDPLRQVTDLAGARIIVYNLSQIDRVAKLIEENFNVDRENTEDRRQAQDPQKFGYVSLHYVVQLTPERSRLIEFREFANMKCEIQVRTALQHAWAEIQHDAEYKSEKDVPFELRRAFAGLAAVLELADKQFEELGARAEQHRATVGEQVEKGELAETAIDSDSLATYLKRKTRDGFRMWDSSVTPTALSEIVEEVLAVGIQSLKNLDDDINAAPLKEIEKTFMRWKSRAVSFYHPSIGANYLLRAILMYNHADKYEEFVRSRRAWGQNLSIMRYYESIGRLSNVR